MDEDLMKQRKMAIALACISSKPLDMTGEQHASKLCSMYQMSQHMWRERYEKAQQKILHLQQELVLQSLENNDEASLDDCKASADILFTPPLSETVCKDHTTAAESLIHHTNFLQSLLNLKQITTYGNVINPTVLRTITNSISSFCQCLQGKENLSNVALRACFRHINQLVNIKQVFSSEEILHGIQQLGTILVDKVLGYRAEKTRRSLVAVCSEISHSIFLCSVMRPLLDKIEMFSEHLRQVSQGDVCFDVDLYERVPSLFHMAEMIVLGLQKNNQSLDQDIFEEINSRLENSLLYVSDTFPLYAHAIWKLQGMIENCAPHLGE